jgi:ATP-dependent RNA helicase DeaD
MKKFKELGLDKILLKILEEIGFDEPTEIQEKVIPLALAGKDVIAESATGSGKTLAFGAPIVEKIKTGEGLQVLILAPTRELAEQDSRYLRIFSKYSTLKIITIYGGVSLLPQIEDLEKADVVVGTPGRILDHISRKTINLSKIKILVLDEADRMLDMGFIHDVTDIIHHCPKNRQSLLFSATISSDIERIAGRYMTNPINVFAESYVDASKLKQVFYDVPTKEKFSLLAHLLREENSKLVMIFCNTKRTADFVGYNLKKYGFDALTLHGDLNQNQRKRILEHFHKSDKFILVCTDVAARGLDIKNVSHVYNYDSPKTSVEYIHRIGRTARAGKDGKAITLLSERDYDNFRRVSSDSSLDIEQIELPEFEKVFIKVSGLRREGGFGGGLHRRFGGRRQGRFGNRSENRSFGSRNRHSSFGRRRRF